MPSKLKTLQVFIASPGGLDPERKAIRHAIDEFNRTTANPNYGMHFKHIGWEDSQRGRGRAQKFINPDLRRSDYCLFVLYDRWGSPPDPNSDRFSSGTEEEYHVATECMDSGAYPMKQIGLIFKAVHPDRMANPDEQLTKVLEFRAKCDNNEILHFYHSFDTIEKLGDIVRHYLNDWLRNELEGEVEPVRRPKRERVDEIDDPMSPEHWNNLKSHGFAVISDAWLLADQGRITEAELAFAKIEDKTQAPRAMLEYGRFLERTGRAHHALALYVKAKEKAEVNDDQRSLASAHSNIGHVYFGWGRWNDAESEFRNARNLFKRIDEPRGLMRSYSESGMLQMQRGHTKEAESMFREALSIARQGPKRSDVSVACINLANVLDETGRFDEALKLYQESLDINNELKLPDKIAASLGGLGNLHLRCRQPDVAEDLFQQALAISEKLQDLSHISTAYTNLGQVALMRALQDPGQQTAHLSSASGHFEKVLHMATSLGDQDQIARAYGKLGAIEGLLKNLNGVDRYFALALNIKNQLGSLRTLAGVYGNYARALAMCGEIDRAEDMCNKAIQVAQEIESRDIVESVQRFLKEIGRS